MNDAKIKFYSTYTYMKTGPYWFRKVEVLWLTGNFFILVHDASVEFDLARWEGGDLKRGWPASYPVSTLLKIKPNDKLILKAFFWLRKMACSMSPMSLSVSSRCVCTWRTRPPRWPEQICDQFSISHCRQTSGKLATKSTGHTSAVV